MSSKIVDIMGMRIDCLDHSGTLDALFSGLKEGRGGWIVTANLDILRKHVVEPEMHELYGAADVRVADGMPLVWASRIMGDPLPERIAGSTLSWTIAARAASEGRSLYLLGGDPGAAEGARVVLTDRFKGLNIVGLSSPRVSKPVTEAELDGISAELEKTKPDIVYVAFGSPKQEYVCRGLRARFPKLWFIGVGISLSFIAGQVDRAPQWMQDRGLEWFHRLLQEPKRLGRRYLVEDLPFVARLFASATLERIVRK